MSAKEGLEKEIVSYGMIRHPNLLPVTAMFHDAVSKLWVPFMLVSLVIAYVCFVTAKNEGVRSDRLLQLSQCD